MPSPHVKLLEARRAMLLFSEDLEKKAGLILSKKADDSANFLAKR